MRSLLATGFSLVELLIGLGIASLLLVMGLPSFVDFMVNSNIRNAAESVADGLRIAQGQAVKLNSPVQFILTPATGWTVRNVATATNIETGLFVSGAKKATITPNVVAGSITFNELGRTQAANADASPLLDFVDFTSADITTPHALRVLTGSPRLYDGGTTLWGIRMCDPNLPAGDAKRCPGP